MTDGHGGCFHCGLPVPGGDPYQGEVAGQRHSFCCAGCKAVAEAIDKAGLTDYYRQRTSLPETPGDVVPDELRDAPLFDREEVQASFVRWEEDAREASLILEGITCAACIWLNERQLQATPGILDAQVNYTTHRARVRWDPERIQLSQILERIAAIGYRAHPYDPERQEAAVARERRDLLNRIGMAAMATIQLMMIAVGIYAADFYPIQPRFLDLFRWISLVLATPVLLYSARPFFTGAWRSLRRRQGSMDIPVALALGLTYMASAYATWLGRGDTYFETMAMFVLFLLTSRYLEMNARKQAAEANESLSRLVPAMARKMGDGGQEWVPVGDLATGDRVRVLPGETIPVDGTIEAGETAVDEAALTGESTPVHRGTEDRVLGGTLNGEGALTVAVERVGQETFVSGVLRLLEEAQSGRPKIARQAEWASHWFVWGLLAAAVGVGGIWLVVEPGRAFWIVVSLLIITCPCALALATPTALVVATGELAKRGVMTARGEALETVAHGNRIFFDKTGTLTEGRLRLTDWTGNPEGLATAAALEAASEHPVARALVEAAPKPALAAAELENHPGRGVLGRIRGEEYRVGAADWVRAWAGEPEANMAQAVAEYRAAGHTVVALARGGEWLAVFAVTDTVRPEAPQAVAALRRQGWAVTLLTGDEPAAAGAVAEATGIREIYAAQLPEGKLEQVRVAQSRGEVVAVVGDGLNDGPVLAGADVSLAMGAGVQTARATADFILLSNRIGRVPEVARIGRATLANIRSNLRLSFAYNGIAVPLAAFGWVAPWMAAILMPASSLAVVGNALRLRRRIPKSGAAVRAEAEPVRKPQPGKH